MHKYTQALKVSALALVLSFGLSYVYAWTAPTVSAPGGNVAAPINTSAVSQTKAGDIAVNGATHFLDTGTTIPSDPAGGNGAVALNGWPNYSDVAANAVKLAGLTSADILSAQTATAGSGMNMFVKYGDATSCPSGWTTAYTGHITTLYVNPVNGVGAMQGVGAANNALVCSGGDYPALTASMGVGATSGSEFWPMVSYSTANKVMSCAVCVR